MPLTVEISIWTIALHNKDNQWVITLGCSFKILMNYWPWMSVYRLFMVAGLHDIKNYEAMSWIISMIVERERVDFSIIYSKKGDPSTPFALNFFHFSPTAIDCSCFLMPRRNKKACFFFVVITVLGGLWDLLPYWVVLVPNGTNPRLLYIQF